MYKPNKSVLVASLCASLVLIGSSGCSSVRNPFSRNNDERSNGRVADDRKITRDVRRALAQEPVYKFNDVDVRTFAGVVQLGGFVNTDDQKRRAEEIARSRSGVTQVFNGIALKSEATPTPTGRTETGGTEQPHIYAAPPASTSSSTNNQVTPKNQ